MACNPIEFQLTRETQHRLPGTVQIDDSQLGGERAGGTPGRGSENMVPFVAAVSLNDDGNPLHAKFTPVPGFTRQVISVWGRDNLTVRVMGQAQVHFESGSSIDAITLSAATISPSATR